MNLLLPAIDLVKEAPGRIAMDFRFPSATGGLGAVPAESPEEFSRPEAALRKTRARSAPSFRQIARCIFSLFLVLHSLGFSPLSSQGRALAASPRDRPNRYGIPRYGTPNYDNWEPADMPFPIVDKVVARYRGMLPAKAIKSSLALHKARSWLVWSAQKENWPEWIRKRMTQFESDLGRTFNGFLGKEPADFTVVADAINRVADDYALMSRTCTLHDGRDSATGPWVEVSVRTVQGPNNADVGGFVVSCGSYFRTTPDAALYVWPPTSNDRSAKRTALRILIGSPLRFWASRDGKTIESLQSLPAGHRYEAVIRTD